MNKGWNKIFNIGRIKIHSVVWNKDKPILYIIFILLLLIFFNLFKQICGILLLFILFFFRSPDRYTIKNSKAVLSPCDGIITHIESNDSHHTINIFMSIFNCHVNYIPISGIVTSKSYAKGNFKFAFNENISSNETSTISIKHGTQEIFVSQIAGFLARRIETNIKIGESVNAGNEYGIIYFGSSIRIQIPNTSELFVCEMQAVRACETVIATLS